MVNITDLQSIVHLRTLDARKLERIINNTTFIDFWGTATKENKLKIIKLIRRNKPNKIMDFIIETDLESSSVFNLRKIASYLHIKNYSRLSKLQLIQEIKDAGKRC